MTNKITMGIDVSRPVAISECIVDILQNYVDKVTEHDFKEDECPPKFKVSILYEKDIHKLILTVDHLGSSFSTVLFPNMSYEYGYEGLRQEMQHLYNLTM